MRERHIIYPSTGVPHVQLFTSCAGDALKRHFFSPTPRVDTRKEKAN